MPLGEIARRLFKPRWADHKQFIQALNAFGRLSLEDQLKVGRIATNSKYVNLECWPFYKDAS